MPNIDIRYLRGPDIAGLNMTKTEMRDAQYICLSAQGNEETAIEPRMHLMPDLEFQGHFSVLRGYSAPLHVAGVKIVGDFVRNYKRGSPSEFGTVTLMDGRTEVPLAVVGGTGLSDMRSGTMTAVGAKHLAPGHPCILGHIGARDSAYWKVRLLDHLFNFEEIRMHSPCPESRTGFGDKLTEDVGKPIVVSDKWRDWLQGADILVEASRLKGPGPLFQTDGINPGALLTLYGTHSTVTDDLFSRIDKTVVHHSQQCQTGPFGCLRRFIEAGTVTRENRRRERGNLCAGNIPDRTSDRETILFWHRGLSIPDVAHATLRKAENLGVGHTLPSAI